MQTKDGVSVPGSAALSSPCERSLAAEWLKEDGDSRLWVVAENSAVASIVRTSKPSSASRSATLSESETCAKMEGSYKLVMSVDMVRAKLSELWLEKMVEGCAE